MDGRAGTQLSRERILRTALRYADGSGLAALSMHKLGAELGVKAMTLYYYVDNKDDVLDGLVDLLWAEIDTAAIARADWQAATRRLARALRDLIRRHPRSAPALVMRPVSSAPQLRVYATYLDVLDQAGIERNRAVEMLRILLGYGFGYAQAELTWSQTSATEPAATITPNRRRHIERTVAGLPGDLLAVAQDVCRGADRAAHFNLGLDLMLRGLATERESAR